MGLKCQQNLDFFQPATQYPSVIDKITDECYQPLIDFFNTKKNAKFSVSVSNSLIELLQAQGKEQIITGLKEAIVNRKIEMLHTGAHHSIFPLIPETEVKHQINLDLDIKKKLFGNINKTGIFSPELCYSDKLLPLYNDLNFQWTVIDDEVMRMNGITSPLHEIFCVNSFGIFMRSRLWSDKVKNKEIRNGEEFVRELENEFEKLDQSKNYYKIITLSGETFGHHISFYQETFLRDMCCSLSRSPTVELCLISDLWDKIPLRKVEKTQEQGKEFEYFPSCSYGTQQADYQHGDYYPHWKSSGNPVHDNLWKLSNLIMNASQEIFAKADKQEIVLSKTNHDSLRKQLDRAFYSTQYSHASIWDWKPNEVYRGIDTQMQVFYLCAEIINTSEFLREGESIYTQLMWNIFEEDYNRQIDWAKKHNMNFKIWKDWKKATLETLESLEMSIYKLQEVHKRHYCEPNN